MVAGIIDRRVSRKLEKALYPNINWNVTLGSDDGTTLGLREDHNSGAALPSFCYDLSNPRASMLSPVRRFCHDTFYTPYYCSKGLGTTSRAPIAAVVFDMIDLITYLSKIVPSLSAPQPLSLWLEDFLKSHPNLRSLPQTATAMTAVEDRWTAVSGFLYDLFCIVTGLRVGHHWKFGYLCGSDSHVGEVPSWAHYILPGPDFLNGDPPIDGSSVSDGPIEELDAAFICSGPFKIRFTHRLGDHLQLNTVKRELLLYWEDDLSNYLMFFGHKAQHHSKPGLFKRYEGHVLRRFVHSHSGSDLDSLLHAKRVALEVKAVLELLFLRDQGKSIRLLRKLLGTDNGYHLRTFRDDDERIMHKMSAPAKIAHLREFNVYRPHLAYSHQQMLGWKPRSLSELVIPGYSDRLSWYTATFAIVFGVLGLLSVVTSIVQMGLAIVALKVAQEQLRLQILQLGNSTGG